MVFLYLGRVSCKWVTSGCIKLSFSTLQFFRHGGGSDSQRRAGCTVEGGNPHSAGVRKWLGNPYMSREQLLTFDMLERHPLVTNQVEYEFQWDQVDALYEFIDRLPAWVVDDEVMEVWRTGSKDAPQSFRGWEAKKAEWGPVLMLSW